ncbi:GNAT family N-acetyltransferase [Arthrobacter sp. MYb211]|uniref:GNAT family N-acetyltransferase n=1 Tax=unclassified Arthrobacter TaxID=235627 RepID=UPI000CFBD6BD|nr:MULTISPECIES: GNAT family N-acetyltransferase [unclassified Arthrobacter]PRA10327.1 GNAT family N-acetyltransferase [Arthrobacter sp. MYb221]PRC05874.1 GNAT family N-acetyltransferase [Arthrobacter sp. MYb211]
MTAQQPEHPVQKIVHQGLRMDHDPGRGRYSLWHGSTFIGFIGYHREEQLVTLQHTIVNEEFGRRGYARALVTMVLDELRAEGAKIVPECSYVQDYLSRYPEYHDMLA